MLTQGLFYLAEEHHGKWDIGLKRRVLELAAKDKPDAILIETKQAANR